MLIPLPKKKKIFVSAVAILLVVAVAALAVLPPLVERGIFPDSITLDFKTYNVRVGDSHRVYANAIYKDKSIEVVENVKCKSSDEKILETDGNTIIGKKEGEATLTVKYWWRETKIKVSVHDIESAFEPSAVA